MDLSTDVAIWPENRTNSRVILRLRWTKEIGAATRGVCPGNVVRAFRAWPRFTGMFCTFSEHQMLGRARQNSRALTASGLSVFDSPGRVCEKVHLECTEFRCV